jgi:hypothetical protein
MTDANTTDAVEAVEATNEAASYDVRQRNGKKGPGKHVVTVATKGDAETIKGILEGEAEDGVQTIIKANQAVVIVTVEDFKAGREAYAAKEQARKDALALLSPEQQEALGVTL